MAAAGRALLAISKSNPVAFGVTFSTIKTSAADLLVQLKFENKKFEDVDWRRNSSFAMFGCFYLGGIQYFLYVPFFGRLFPNAASFAAKPIREKMTDFKGMAAVLGQVFIDQCVHHPLLYFPVFYSLKEVVGGGSVSDGLTKYSNNYKEDMVALWKVWVPATLFNFTFSPMYLRIPVVASTSLLWTCILSAMRGSNDAPLSTEEALDQLGNQGAALFHKTKPLDPGLDHVIVMASGPDRVGLLSTLSNAVVTSAQGNVSETKMVKMGGQFMTMMVVSMDPGKKKALNEALTDPNGDVAPLLSVTLTDISAQNRLSASEVLLKRHNTMEQNRIRAGTFKVEGVDKAGIVAEVTSVLAKNGVNIDRMDTVTLVKDGKPVFVMTGQVRCVRKFM